MDSHSKKMVAPLIITALVVIYYLVYFGLIVKHMEGVLRCAFGVVPLVLAGVMIHVCIQRIKEIKGGEEDDIGKY